MDLITTTVFKTALEHLQAGLTADCQHRFKDAALTYMEGVPLLMQLAREDGLSLPIKQHLKSKIKLYLNRIQLIKDKLEAKEEVPPQTVTDGAKPNMDGFEKESQEFLKILSYQPMKCSLEEVKGMDQAKEFLLKNIVLPLTFPGLPDSVTRVKKGVLLYGLPGTGKTMLMGAVAATVSCPVFRLTTIDLISRCMESELSVERVRDIFRLARQNQPCIVCIDDLEMVCARDGVGGSTTGKIREELIVQLMELSAENLVTVIAATQHPWALTGTLRRRFDRRFYLSLPSEDERAQILSRCFSDIKHQLSETDFEHVAQLTAGYTGSDLCVVAKSCAMAWVRTIQKATHFRKVTMSLDEGGNKCEQEMLVPCDPQEPGALEITFDFLNLDRLLEVPVSRPTVEEELKQMRPSIGDAELQQMNQWHDEFGQED